MVHTRVSYLGKRLVGLFLFTLAIAGLSLVSVVTTATSASATDPPPFELPLCGDGWRGATRADHPTGSGSFYALDFNKGSGSYDRGEIVVASADGVIDSVGSRYGSVKIRHGNGWTTSSLHMDPILVSPGDVVRKGEFIGYVNGRGPDKVTGVVSNDEYAPHLHFEQRLNGGLVWIVFNGVPVEYVYDYNGPEFTGTSVCGGLLSFTNAPHPIITDGAFILGEESLVDSTLYAEPFANTWVPQPDSPLTYQWYRGDDEDSSEKIVGATGDHYTPSQVDIGRVIWVEVTGVRSEYYDTPAMSLNGVEITANPFESLPAPGTVFDGEVTGVVDSTLYVNTQTIPAAWTPTPDHLTYKWYRTSIVNGVETTEPISGVTDPYYTPQQSDIDKYIWVRITGEKDTYRDGVLDSTRMLITADHFDDFTGSPATIVGVPRVEGTLTAFTTITTPDVQTVIEWLRLEGGSYTVVGTGSSYVPTSEDVGKIVKARFTFSKLGFETQSFLSNQVTIEAIGGSSAVEISGSPEVGHTLTADYAVIPVPGVVQEITWLENGVSRATGSTLLLTSSDAGARLQVRYRLYVQGTLVQTYYSSQVIVDFEFSGVRAAISGTNQVEYTLTANTTITTSGVTQTIEWLRNVDGASTVVGTGSTYTLTDDDINNTIKVRYTFSKFAGASLSYTSSPVTVTGYYDYSFGGVPATISGTAKVEYPLTAGTTITTPGVTTMGITWYRVTPSGNVYVGSGSTYTATSADIDYPIVVRYMFDKQGYPLAEYYSLPVTIADYSYFYPTGTSVGISGTARVEFTLSSYTTVAPTPSSTSIYWLNGTTVVGTGSSYTLKSTDIGDTIKVKYVFDRQGYPQTTWYSPGVTVAGYYNYTFSNLPASISGTLRTYNTLTAGTSLTTAPVVNKSYQWFKSGSSTVLGTGSTYRPTTPGSYQVKITFNKTDALGYQPVTYSSPWVTVVAAI